ncbi:MAG: hypothetical protein Q9222_007711 [Ikaeria aurantiellina]
MKVRNRSQPMGANDWKSRLNLSESELTYLRQRCDGLLVVYQSMMTENQELRSWKSQAEGELQAFRNKNRLLEEELQACKDDLFKMQPRSKVPDSEVARAYDDLHEHIASWVEAEISKSEKEFRRCNHGPVPSLFRCAEVPGLEEFLSTHPISGGEYLLRCVVLATLRKLIFADNIVLLGLDDWDSSLVRRIEQSMIETKPARDDEFIDGWRSDTLSALSTSGKLQRSRRNASHEIVQEVLDTVEPFFPSIRNTKGTVQRLLEKVVNPAVALATMIQTSSTKYKFFPDITSRNLLSTYTLNKDDLSIAKLIDVSTRRTLKVDSPFQADEQGQIGTQIMLLAPGLYRINTSTAPLPLVKEIKLIELFKPLGRRRGA